MADISSHQFSIFMARVALLQEMMETLLMKEIEQDTEVGRHWVGRAETARKMLKSNEAWKPIRKTPRTVHPDWVDPTRQAFEETVWIVERAADLARSNPKGRK